MKGKTINTILIVLVFIFCTVGFQSGIADESHSKIDSFLQSVMNSTPDDQMIDAYIVLKDRMSYDQLKNLTFGLERRQRRQAVVDILKQHAESTQRRVLSFLHDSESRGLIENIRQIWIINVLAFRAQPAIVYDLANGFDEIEKIFYDARYPIDELLDDGGIAKHNRENNLFNSGRGNRALQPGLILINAQQVWAEGDSGQGAIVANIDTGTDWDHPDLVNNIWNNLGEDADGDGHTLEWTGSTWVFDPGDINNTDDDGNGYIDDFIGWAVDNNTNNPNDSHGHGTQTSGLVAGDGTNGTQTGVAPRAKLMILKNETGGESAYWQAEQYAITNGADVITSSLSFKWYFSPQPNYPMFRQMTDMELAAGIIHTNSTSNDGNSVGVPFNISAPGNCPGPWIHPDQTLVGGISSVVGAANVNAISDIIASSSPWGPAAWEDFQINHPSYPYPMPPQYQDYPYETQPGSMGLLKPDVAAPGEGTTSTTIGGGYGSFGGTSGATPHVGGTAALLLSINPDLEPEDVSRILQTTAVEKGTPGKDNRYGAGRIDAYAAYLQALAEAGAPFPPTNLTAYSDYTAPTSMLLNWENPTHLQNGDPLTPDAFSIVIYREGVYVDSIPGTNSDYTDTGLNDGQEYTYEIYAVVDSSGRASGSASASWIAGGSPIPDPPTEFGISSHQNQVTLRWRNPNTNIDGTPMDDFAGVYVYQGSDSTIYSRSSADTAGMDSVTFTPLAGNPPEWYLRAFDNESPTHKSAATAALIIPLNVPVLDNFATAGLPNPGYWQNWNADVNDRGVNMPSEPYALNLNGMPSGGDTVISYPIDLHNAQGSGMVFSYFYQPQGTGNAPEPGDSLQVHFKNNLGDWVKVRGYPGSTVQDFQHEVIDIETAPNGGGSYLYSQFQIRIKSRGSANPTTPNDDWFVDNTYLGLPAPAIAASQDSVLFDTTLVGDTSSIEIEIHNVGVQPLVVSQVLGSGGIFGVDVTSFTVDVGSAQGVNISFSPQTQGDYTGWIRFVSNDPVNDTLSVYVEGSAKQVTGIAEGEGLPTTFGVSPNYPNPFNPTTTIKYQLPQTSDVKLAIYNALGQRVRTLVDARIEAGYHSAEWDGRNDAGAQVASGIYIYRFSADNYLRVQKMILMK